MLMILVISWLFVCIGVLILWLLLLMVFCILIVINIMLIVNLLLIIFNDLIVSVNNNLLFGVYMILKFGLFSVMLVGLVLVVLGVVFFYFFICKLLLECEDECLKVILGCIESYFVDIYGIVGEIVEFIVIVESLLVGMSIGEVE